MDKEFEKWLKQDDLYTHFIKNPNQQQQIYNDFKREQIFSSIESVKTWVDWLVNNQELAEKLYPEVTDSLKLSLKKRSPFYFANVIQNVPLSFPKWKAEADSHLPKRKRKLIQQYIDLLQFILIDSNYKTEIEIAAFESVKSDLHEQLEYWIEKLEELNNNLKPKKTVVKKYKAKFYALTFIIESIAKGKQMPIGRKTELEKIGNTMIGPNKGNRFYKVFCEIISLDLNSETALSDTFGINWKKDVLNLSENPEIVSEYLQKKYN